jgi:PAS domain-containing protein
MPGSTLSLQSFVASAMLMLYTVSAVLQTRRAAERRLQEIVSLHALVTENSRDAILIVDRDGFPSYASPAIERITGLKPTETEGHGFAEMVHPADLPQFGAALERLKEGQMG